jgi:transcriptional regulator NrdR family protein
MTCPRCEAESRVIDSGRGRDAPHHWRRRVCQNPACRYRWDTLEIIKSKLRQVEPKAAYAHA